MKSLIPKGFLLPLIALFLIGIFIRFLNFNESIYFGYDEARDAYISQDIYLKGDLRIIGPQASAFAGMHHGPLYYYLLGPLFILGQGAPELASVFFRVLNTLGVFGIFIIGNIFFSPIVGLISAFIFTFSYEQFIYAIFTGNPSVSNIAWIPMFVGLGLIYRKKNVELGLFLTIFFASIIPQFDMIVGYSLLVMLVTLYLFKSKLRNLKFRNIFLLSLIGFTPLYTYLIAELKYGFLTLKTGISLIVGKLSILKEGESAYDIFYKNLLNLFRDNIIDFNIHDNFIISILIIIFLYLLIKSKKNKKYLTLIIWPLSFSVLMLAKGFMPFYSYAGVGIGLILATSILLNKILKFNRLIFLLIIVFIGFSNMQKINYQSTRSLIVEIKAQPGMKLSDEKILINKTYEYSSNEAFTIRVTSMPYKIQTVWAYLYKQYGEKQYGYLPFLETGNILGFPGELPIPKNGTTCYRFLIREPIRGIPQNLIDKDEAEENLFSEIIKTEKIGEFVLQFRKSKAKDCHNIKPVFDL